MVAMTTITSHMDGAAIFNPLVDAPPEPPRPLAVSSYQHSTPIHVTTTSSTCPPGDIVISTEPNYYYSSSMNAVSPLSKQHSHSMITPTFYDLEFQEQPPEEEQRWDRPKHYHSSRILLLMGILCLVLLAWKKHWQFNHHDGHPTPFLPIMMNFGNHLFDKKTHPPPHALVDSSILSTNGTLASES